jgi:hypothetical protein
MQFRVPKFIEIEDKIIGPFTLQQFLYLAGGIVTLAILWFFLELGLFIIIAIPIIIFCSLLAFYKFNGRPFTKFLSTFLRYLLNPKLYIWKKKNK